MARVTMVTPPSSSARLDSMGRSGRRSPPARAAMAATPGSHPAAVLAGHEEILPPGGATPSAALPGTGGATMSATGVAGGSNTGGGGGGDVGSGGPPNSTPPPPPWEPPLSRYMWRLGAALDAAAPRTLAAAGVAATAVAAGVLSRAPSPTTPHQALWVFQCGAGAAGAAFVPLAYRLRRADLPPTLTHVLLPAWVAVVGLPLAFYGLRELFTGHRRPGTTAWSAVWRVYAIMTLWALFAWTNEHIIRPHLALATWPERLGLTGPPRGPRIPSPPREPVPPLVGARSGGGSGSGGGRVGSPAATASSAAAAAAASAAALRAAVETAHRERAALLERLASKMEELHKASEAADTSNKLLERARARLGAAAAEAMEGIVGGGGLDELVVLEGVVTCAIRYRDSCREGVGEVEREIGRVEERCERLEAEVAALQEGGGLASRS